MNKKKQSKLIPICTFLFLTLSGWYIYRDFTIIQNPANNPQVYDLSTNSLIAQIEKQVAGDLTSTDSQLQLERSNVHFDLARFHAYLGNRKEAQDHLNKISFNSNKIDLLQIYTLMMLNAASSGNYGFVFETLLNARDISEKIRKIG